MKYIELKKHSAWEGFKICQNKNARPYLFTEMASCEAGSTLGKEEDLAIISGVLVSALVAILRPLDCLYWEI